VIRVNRHPVRIVPPRSHVTTHPRPARIYDWGSDPELCGENDHTPPAGIDTTEIDGWLTAG